MDFLSLWVIFYLYIFALIESTYCVLLLNQNICVVDQFAMMQDVLSGFTPTPR